MSRFMLIAGCSLALLARTSAAGADELADAKEALAKEDVRVLSGGVVLAAEGDLVKELGKAASLRRALLESSKNQAAAEQALAKGEQTMTALRKRHIFLSAQLARVAGNVTLNNQLVGQLNALEGQMELGKKELARLEEQVKAARSKTNDAREAYVQFVLDTRKLANQIAADYEAKAAAPQVQAALSDYNQAAGKDFKLQPSPAFAANVRRLTQIEETVLSESIPITGEGNVARVATFVDGKYPQEMVIDSGASVVLLPWAVAAKYGLKPTDNDQKLRLVLADGREIEGWAKTIPSLRVGKFEVKKVECAVLGEEATNAEALLGMSFLRHFKFELDSNAKTLTMVKIAGADVPPAK